MKELSFIAAAVRGFPLVVLGADGTDQKHRLCVEILHKDFLIKVMHARSSVNFSHLILAKVTYIACNLLSSNFYQFFVSVHKCKM